MFKNQISQYSPNQFFWHPFFKTFFIFRFLESPCKKFHVFGENQQRNHFPKLTTFTPMLQLCHSALYMYTGGYSSKTLEISKCKIQLCKCILGICESHPRHSQPSKTCFGILWLKTRIRLRVARRRRRRSLQARALQVSPANVYFKHGTSLLIFSTS